MSSGDALFLKAPYSRFKEFIAPGTDRFAGLCSVLEENAVPFRILEIAGKRHIAAGPLQKTRRIFTAHYDRTKDSPGANDNGAAVFILAETAMQNNSSDGQSCGKAGNALFIFTDGEELSGGESLTCQGAYSLGLFLQENGMGDAEIFAFDACGAGDTLVISTAADYLLKNETGPGADAARQKVQSLRNAALDAARTAQLEKVLLLPTPFSDDAGFLRSGMAAQTVTVLPQKEAAAFASLVRLREDAAAALFSSAAAGTERHLIPETWRSLNGPGDSPLRLTPEHWKRVRAFAAALGENA